MFPNMKDTEYIQPQVDYIILDNEGVLCESSSQTGTEKLNTNNGIW